MLFLLVINNRNNKKSKIKLKYVNNGVVFKGSFIPKIGNIQFKKRPENIINEILKPILKNRYSIKESNSIFSKRIIILPGINKRKIKTIILLSKKKFIFNNIVRSKASEANK
jgi:hypothetical protein